MTIISSLYGLMTALICIWAVWLGMCKNARGLDCIGAATFLGWVYYQTTSKLTGFSLEQAFLAFGDLVQASVILWAISKNKLGRIPLWSMILAFTAMFALHFAAFKVENTASFHYHTLLNIAYVVQLATIGGMALRHEFEGHASNFRSTLFGRFSPGGGNIRGRT